MLRFILLIGLSSGLLAGYGQAKKPTKKEIIAHLTGSTWKVVHNWDGRYPEESTQDVPTLNWEEMPLNDSRYSEYFGPAQITFKVDGTFVASLIKGGTRTGKWTIGKKGGITFTYKDEYDFETSTPFEAILIRPNGFVASGDICRDGCYAKVEFEKVNQGS